MSKKVRTNFRRLKISFPIKFEFFLKLPNQQALLLPQNNHFLNSISYWSSSHKVKPSERFFIWCLLIVLWEVWYQLIIELFCCLQLTLRVMFWAQKVSATAAADKAPIDDVDVVKKSEGSRRKEKKEDMRRMMRGK